MSSQRPIQSVERPNNYAAFHLSLLYLIIIIIIIIYLGLHNSQSFTIQGLEITILNSNYSIRNSKITIDF